MDRFQFIREKNFNELPKTSGVYSFWEGKEAIYIGKAINIKDRVKNHFQQPSYRDNLFIHKVERIGFFETNSEIEALVLEANLIKKNQPKFNVIWKDDKNYFYVAITNDERPIVYITHQKTADAQYIGPFVEGTPLKKTLKFLRRAFPYYTSTKHPKTKCTWCHLGLCPGPNPDLKEYKKNLKKLILILQGKRGAVLASLKKEMAQFSKESKFEEAGKIRDKMIALQNIMSHTHVLETKDFVKSDLTKSLRGLLGLEKISRIECYDVSNIQGKQAVSSMVVFENGVKNKNEYRKFKIRMENEPNDIAMLKETLQRRFTHKEWTFPEVILIDGGKAQLNVGINAKNTLSPRTLSQSIKVISIAKGRQELFIEGRENPIPLKQLPREVFNLVKQLDDEAHRFAITYHKKLRKKNLLR